MNFTFSTAGQIIFGAGKLNEVEKWIPPDAKRVLLVTGRGGADPRGIMAVLGKVGVEAVSLEVPGEPDVALVERGVRVARSAGCGLVIGFGGGSVIDTGKAVAALLANPGELLDYLEVVGKNQPLLRSSVPYIAVPTTAGTGAEVTRNAVLAVPEQRFKVSLRSSYLLPSTALVDPELTLSLPPGVTASTGMDALTQLIEPYVSNRANPLSDLFCRAGILRVARSLRVAYHDGADLDARTDMSFASLLGGLALANSGLGAVHGFASPIGGMFPAPHGAVCARLLPAVAAVNVQALQSRSPGHPALLRYREIAGWLVGSSRASIQDGIQWLEDLVHDLSIPPLSTYGIRSSDLREIAEKASIASSMKANPIVLQTGELLQILSQALN